jgi:hypothetical protein
MNDEAKLETDISKLLEYVIEIDDILLESTPSLNSDNISNLIKELDCVPSPELINTTKLNNITLSGSRQFHYGDCKSSNL